LTDRCSRILGAPYASGRSRRAGCTRCVWLKDDRLADSDNLSPAKVIAQEIGEDLEAALEEFR